MADGRDRTPAWAFIWRAGRFLYLLWGGMLLVGQTTVGQLRVPAWAWEWQGLASWLAGPLGGGLLFGVGLAMAAAALGEVWELVDLALLRLTRFGAGGR